MTLKTKTAILPYKLQLQRGERLGRLDDPPPIPDGMFQNPSVIYAYNALFDYGEEREGVFVDTNTFVYYDRDDRNLRVAPDCYVALGVEADSIRKRNGYFVWEVDKPPDLVLEVASESTAANDLTFKRDLYARIRVKELWLCDPSGGELYGAPLIGEELSNGEYRRLPMRTTPDGDAWARSPALGVDFHWKNGRLRIYDPQTGEFWGDYTEERRGRLEERRGRLKERRRRRTEEAENRRLRERLSRLLGRE